MHTSVPMMRKLVRESMGKLGYVGARELGAHSCRDTLNSYRQSVIHFAACEREMGKRHRKDKRTYDEEASVGGVRASAVRKR